MADKQAPILSYFFLSRNPRGLRAMLLGVGILTLLLAWKGGIWWPEIQLPAEILWGLGGATLGLFLISFIPRLSRYLFDLAFLVFVFYYLAIIFLSYLNLLPPIFVTILIATQILFAISFRNFFEFLVFAIASLCLFVVCTFFIPNLETQPYLFVILMAIATIFSGVYIWSREKFMYQVRHSGSMLGDLLDSSVFAIFLLEIDEGLILYQNRIAASFMERFFPDTELSCQQLLQQLSLSQDFLHDRFPQASAEDMEQHIYQLSDANGELRDLECYLSRIRTMREDCIFLRIRDISGIKAQERDLKRTSSLNQSLLSTLPDGLLTVDTEGMVTVSHEPQHQTHPLPLSRFADQPFEHLVAYFFPPAQQQKVLDTLAQQQQPDRIPQFEFPFSVGGKENFFELRMVRLPDDAGTLLLLRDITQTKASEKALIESEKTYREIFNAGTAGIVILDPQDFHVLDANLIAVQMLGREANRLIGQAFGSIAIPSQQEELHEFLSQTVAGDGRQIEIFLQPQGEEAIPVEITANLTILRGEFRLMLILGDIAERLEKRAALKASEQRYRTLVEKMNEGLVMTDQAENILFVNKRMGEILGMERSELLGKRTYEVLHGEDVGQIIQGKQHLRQQGISDQYELRLTKPNGDVIWVLVTGSPYVDPEGKIIGAIAIVTDITARKSTELKLQDKNSQLDAFVYRASHDLKGPLASIIGVTNIARDEVEDAKAHRFLDMISKSTKRLDLILSELIDVTRINKVQIKWESLDFGNFVEEMIKSLQHLPKAEKIDFQVHVHLSEDLVSDKRMLTSILQNLLVNSITYHDIEKPDPFIRIEARQQFDRIHLSVEDNGVGIPERMKKRVFEMFFRGNTQSNGSGLGLYIVKSAVEKLEGHVHMESREGKGTLFSLTLPLKPLPFPTEPIS